jgi:hypothetical protein
MAGSGGRVTILAREKRKSKKVKTVNKKHSHQY